MSFFAEAGKVFLRQRANAAQNLDTQHRINLHGQNQGQQMWLAHVAQGYGLQPEAFLQPYGVPAPNVNINTPALQEKSSVWPVVAGLLMGITGLGAAGGALYAVAGSKTASPPAATTPLNFKLKVGFDEQKGFQFGEPEQVK